jgi:hypothetical protein
VTFLVSPFRKSQLKFQLSWNTLYWLLIPLSGYFRSYTTNFMYCSCLSELGVLQQFLNTCANYAFLNNYYKNRLIPPQSKISYFHFFGRGCVIVRKRRLSVEARGNSLSLIGGVKSTMAVSCRSGLTGYECWRAGMMTTLCHSRLYPPTKDYEFSY